MAGVGNRSTGHGRARVALSRFAPGLAPIDVERRACAGHAQDGQMKAIAGAGQNSYDGQVERGEKQMQIVNIAELKNNLSHYLRQVRQGNEITIKDRNRVIARIVPAAPSADYDEELLELA